MTVIELINMLQALPGEAEVYFHHQYGDEEDECVTLTVLRITENTLGHVDIELQET